MASTKIAQNIDTGLTNRSASLGITASAFWDLGGDGGQYRINYHYDGMPAHKSRPFETLDQLEAAMRQFEPDLRKWNTAA